MKIELSVFKSEVTNRSTGHQTTFNIARFRIATLANPNVFFFRKLLRKSLLLVLFVCAESFRNVYTLYCLSIYLSQQNSFTVSRIGNKKFVVVNYSNKSTRTNISCFWITILKTNFSKFKPFVFYFVECLANGCLNLIIGFGPFKKFVQVFM